MFKFLRPNTKSNKHKKRKSFNALKYANNKINDAYIEIEKHNEKQIQTNPLIYYETQINNNSPINNTAWELRKNYITKKTKKAILEDKIKDKLYKQSRRSPSRSNRSNRSSRSNNSSRSSRSLSPIYSFKSSNPQITKHLKKYNRDFAKMGNAFDPTKFSEQRTPVSKHSGKGTTKKHSFFREIIV
jgi:hypothetical protein